jgi:hypothetical protein
MPELKTPLPCRECSSPKAMDVMHAISQGAFEREANLSPGGLPLQCCRISQAMGTGAPSSRSTSAVPATSGMFSFGGRRSAGSWPPWRQPPLRR